MAHSTLTIYTGIWVERQRSVTSGRGTVVELPTARDISNAVHRYDGEDDGTDTPVSDDVSHMLWAWGQFLAHDIVETPEGLYTFNHLSSLQCIKFKSYAAK